MEALAKPNGQNGHGKPAKPKEPDPPHIAAVKDSLKQHLLALLDKPLSVKMLTAIETTARLSRDLLISMKDPRQLRRRGGGYVGGGVISMGGMTEYGDDVDDGEDSLGYDTPGGGVVNVSPMRAETFAATLMRELVAMGDKWRQPAAPSESASSLVLAISQAKAQGLGEDIVQGLEAKLKAMVVEPVEPKPVEETPSPPPALTQPSVHVCSAEDVGA